MSDIELVIKIPEDLKKMIFDDEVFDIAHSYRLAMCVKNGILLPKGHGRLIDADKVDDEIYKCFEGINCYDGTGYDIYTEAKEYVDKISTIIEADKTESVIEK